MVEFIPKRRLLEPNNIRTRLSKGETVLGELDPEELQINLDLVFSNIHMHVEENDGMGKLKT